MNVALDRFLKTIQGKKIALCGVGISNLSLIDLFLKQGASIILCDSRSKDQLYDDIKNLQGKNLEFHLGENYLKDLNVDIIFRTPGMRFHEEEFENARKRGIIVTSEMEVFIDLCPCKTIGITGSDGKTTTTTIISEMLKAEGKTVHLGGNIGTPLLPKIFEINKNDIAVVELSSFQLISMRKSPDISVVTNLSPNHLDIHKDMTEYIESKKNIILHQNAFGITVLNSDNEIVKRFSDHSRGKTLFFSRKEVPENGVFLDADGNIYIFINGEKSYVMKADDIKIPGLHNAENYLAAICALWGEVSKENMVKVAKTFGGVEHRAEFVRKLNGVKYYNDSIATSPTRLACGTLSLYDQKIILISGGYDKKIPFDELGPIIVDKVKLLILMGETSLKIYDAVTKASAYSKNNPKIIRVNDMKEAVLVAYENAEFGDIVSLAPACASFDAYKNFMERGNHFKELVNNL